MITFTDDNNCEADSSAIITIGIFELENNISISMWPNPTAGVININAEGLNGQKVTATITTSLGASVRNAEYGNLSGVWNNEINISNEADGVYFLTLTVDQETVTYRVVKN